MSQTRTLTQPLARRAVAALTPDSENRAYCPDCELQFNLMFQTKHGHCPECNGSRWYGIPALQGKRVHVKAGWEDAGRMGIALTNPFWCEQFWVAVAWEDEDDPDCFKLSGLGAQS